MRGVLFSTMNGTDASKLSRTLSAEEKVTELGNVRDQFDELSVTSKKNADELGAVKQELADTVAANSLLKDNIAEMEVSHAKSQEDAENVLAVAVEERSTFCSG